MDSKENIKENKIYLKGMLYSEPVIKKNLKSQGEYANILIESSIHKDGKDFSYFNSITIWEEKFINKISSLHKGDGIEIIGRVYNKKVQEGMKIRNITGICVYELNEVKGNFLHENRVELFGRTVDKPNIRNSEKAIYGRAVIAVNNRKSKAHEGSPDYMSVTLFNDVAESAKSIEKGKWTECICVLKNTSYKDNNGKNVYSNELIATEFRQKFWRNKKDLAPKNKEIDISDINYEIEDFAPVEMVDKSFM